MKISNKTNELTLSAMAHDASHYSLKPERVLTPNNLEEMQQLIRYHFESATPVTFRSGGTSLSGQSLTSHSLVDSRRAFKKVEILDNGAKVRVQPGATVREINNLLKPYGYKLGPDPASEIACTIGGVIANNSSGMICGITENSYQTVESMKIVFADGTLFDTSWENADERLRTLQPEIYLCLQNLRDQIRADAESKVRIESLFTLKNTMGYGMNSFLDFDSISEILLHLIIGSEGTLVFIAEATLRTIPLKPALATSLILFDSLREANNSLARILETKPAAIELLDSTSLKVSKRNNPDVDQLMDLSIGSDAALLVEYQEKSQEKLKQTLKSATEILGPNFQYTENLKSRNDLWHLRKGLYAAAAGARQEGATALLEDIAVPALSMTDTCESLTELFTKYQYEDSVIFGHVKDGNIHFMLNEDFSSLAGQKRYEKFTESMVDLVLEKNGTLKAEHGTGRAMAPFVERQYGSKIYRFMVEIKDIFDPRYIFNPDSIISRDARIHLKDLKVIPKVNSIVDKCVECGFCESICPSKELTLTPRQRIVALRGLSGASNADQREVKRALQYEVLDTCAVDGLCQTQCPVGINTGDMVRELRNQNSSQLQQSAWKLAAANWGSFLSLARVGVAVGSILPSIRGVKLSSGKRRVSSETQSPDFIYLPSCINEIFGPSNQKSFLDLCNKTGVKAFIPEGISSTCCGTPWKSKGMTAGGEVIDRNNLKLLTKLRNLRLPIVTDSPSCADGFIRSFQGENILDSTQFIATHILPKLEIKKVAKVVVHPTCSSAKIDENSALITIAGAIANEVVIPPNWGCCGFAGDRGLLIPELTESATREEAGFVRMIEADFYISNNRTCEMAMTTAVGSEYVSVIRALHELLSR